ncbi:hypothetical protein MLD38_030447 [Melastoma candidum]|uniref:Uncharacterized protein n=1 Tax=Melastoma candidum TaxID=119954 RepID=A0ACB9MLN3_9MYRT|nr:hypothetical protein MLD38_030447 [Melastoma candidum]
MLLVPALVVRWSKLRYSCEGPPSTVPSRAFPPGIDHRRPSSPLRHEPRNPQGIRADRDSGHYHGANELIPQLARSGFAKQWVATNVKPNVPATNIVRILVGNEVVSTANRMLIGNLVAAIRALHAALVDVSLDGRIQVSTPQSLGILAESTPLSAGRFREGYDIHVLEPLFSFHHATNSPFMVNPYPFFSCSVGTLDYALFRPNPGVTDENTKLLYSNMLDGQLDAVYSAMKILGFGDVEIVIAETGWPSLGDPSQVGVDAATTAEYNSNLIRHVTSGAGTPFMPNRTFETYIFALFNEDMKPGSTCERNFGLFHPDMTPGS